MLYAQHLKGRKNFFFFYILNYLLISIKQFFFNISLSLSNFLVLDSC